MAFWGIEIKAGQPFTLSPDKSPARLRISQATLGFGSSEKSSSVQCNVGKKIPVLLCTLLPGKAESIHLELEFQEDQGVTFSVIGPRSVHLSGYFVGKVRDLIAGDDESESFGEDIGQTDTEASNESSDEDDYGGSFIDDGELKVLPLSPSTSEEANKKEPNKKKDGVKKSGRKRLKKKFQLSESEDGVTSSANMGHDCVGEQIDDSDLDDWKAISSLRESAKIDHKNFKRKLDDFEGQETNDLSEDRNLDDVVGLVKNKQSEDRRLDVVVEQETNGLPEDRKSKRKKRKSNKKDELSMDLENSPILVKKEADSLMETEGSKSNVGPKNGSGGLVIEELEVGEQDGKVASSGRKVTVHYTGKLKKGGKIFDSTIGKDPLKFRLGEGSALDGLELGIEGMRVGGKRRLLIPPKLGYGSEGTERVPAKSWLIMDVELLKCLDRKVSSIVMGQKKSTRRRRI